MLCSKEARCTPTTAITDPETSLRDGGCTWREEGYLRGSVLSPKNMRGWAPERAAGCVTLPNLSRIFSLGNRWSWQVKGFNVQYSKEQEKDKVWHPERVTWHRLELEGMRCDLTKYKLLSLIDSLRVLFFSSKTLDLYQAGRVQFWDRTKWYICILVHQSSGFRSVCLLLHVKPNGSVFFTSLFFHNHCAVVKNEFHH